MKPEACVLALRRRVHLCFPWKRASLLFLLKAKLVVVCTNMPKSGQLSLRSFFKSRSESKKPDDKGNPGNEEAVPPRLTEPEPVLQTRTRTFAVFCSCGTALCTFFALLFIYTPVYFVRDACCISLLCWSSCSAYQLSFK